MRPKPNHEVGQHLDTDPHGRSRFYLGRCRVRERSCGGGMGHFPARPSSPSCRPSTWSVVRGTRRPLAVWPRHPETTAGARDHERSPRSPRCQRVGPLIDTPADLDDGIAASPTQPTSRRNTVRRRRTRRAPMRSLTPLWSPCRCETQRTHHAIKPALRISAGCDRGEQVPVCVEEGADAVRARPRRDPASPAAHHRETHSPSVPVPLTHPRCRYATSPAGSPSARPEPSAASPTLRLPRRCHRAA
jgi:hypothetical protein